MITYHGTTDLILTQKNITILQSGVFKCNAQYVCRNTDNLEFIAVLARGNRMPQLNVFIIGDEIGMDIGSNGFTTFSVTGYAENVVINELNPPDRGRKSQSQK